MTLRVHIEHTSSPKVQTTNEEVYVVKPSKMWMKVERKDYCLNCHHEKDEPLTVFESELEA